MNFLSWINAAVAAYDVPREDIIINETNTGHVLIMEPLELLLIAYVDTDFGMYMLERIEELFSNGLSFPIQPSYLKHKIDLVLNNYKIY